ncbi:MAG: nucleotidyltransferase domain-containing protein [archaeon]
MANPNSILKQVLEKVKPEKEELELITGFLDKFLKEIEKRVKALKIDAEIFVGGSFAKDTVIKKDHYDVDVFVRFDKKHKDISTLTQRILKGIDSVSLVHGSRDYFRVEINPNFYIELIPVLKVAKPEQAENITDLSYSHVKYINKKVKTEKLRDEIRLAKAFCYANHCYGAESYIRGFSGYGLELLVSYYGSFLKFIKETSKIQDKIVIDIERQHKNKSSIMMDLNSSKLQSPIILIDPTYKQRNVLAALSEETLKKFRKEAITFLKKPSIKSFEVQKKDINKIKKDSEKKGFDFILLEASTNRQEGDIAGSKLLKFYNHLDHEISRFFQIKDKGFNYNKKKSARFFFAVKSRGELEIGGPSIKDAENVEKFKEKHKSTFTKKGRIYAKKNIGVNILEFINAWKLKNKKQIKDMAVGEFRVVG